MKLTTVYHDCSNWRLDYFEASRVSRLCQVAPPRRQIAPQRPGQNAGAERHKSQRNAPFAREIPMANSKNNLRICGEGRTITKSRLKSQQMKFIAKMLGKAAFTVASVLWFSAICGSVPVCFAQDCALPTNFAWTSSGPIVAPQHGWIALKDFSCVHYNGEFI